MDDHAPTLRNMEYSTSTIHAEQSRFLQCRSVSRSKLASPVHYYTAITHKQCIWADVSPTDRCNNRAASKRICRWDLFNQNGNSSDGHLWWRYQFPRASWRTSCLRPSQVERARERRSRREHLSRSRAIEKLHNRSFWKPYSELVRVLTGRVLRRSIRRQRRNIGTSSAAWKLFLPTLKQLR